MPWRNAMPRNHNHDLSDFFLATSTTIVGQWGTSFLIFYLAGNTCSFQAMCGGAAPSAELLCCVASGHRGDQTPLLSERHLLIVDPVPNAPSVQISRRCAVVLGQSAGPSSRSNRAHGVKRAMQHMRYTAKVTQKSS